MAEIKYYPLANYAVEVANGLATMAHRIGMVTSPDPVRDLLVNTLIDHSSRWLSLEAWLRREPYPLMHMDDAAVRRAMRRTVIELTQAVEDIGWVDAANDFRFAR